MKMLATRWSTLKMVASVFVIGIVAIIALQVTVPSNSMQKESTTGVLTSPFPISTEADNHGYKKAQFPREFHFPTDHGPHQNYRSEWWHITGTVRDEAGNYFGLQLTLIRLGIGSTSQERTSRWATNEIYAGVFSLVGPNDPPHTRQRLSRAAAGLAGGSYEPLQIWLEDWRLEQTRTESDTLQLTAQIATDEIHLNLNLSNPQQRLMDENEFRGEGTTAGPPFHLYLQPRLHVTGSLQMKGKERSINGLVAMEHAWGELPLPGGPVAFDRFTLQLNDGRGLFFFRRHRVDGSGSPVTTGILVNSDGRPQLLSRDEIALEPTAFWKSEQTGSRYPTSWTLRIKKQEIDFTLAPQREDQESIAWIPFWAGPVTVHKESSAALSIGDGFVQLYGYSDT